MTVYIKTDVCADELGLPGNRHHCAIANALMLLDPDIVNVRVDEYRIRFSRRSTNMRYEFVTPAEAGEFIAEFDKMVAAADGGGKVRAMTARPFRLVLTDKHLVGVRPRELRDAPRAIRRVAAARLGTPRPATMAAKVGVKAAGTKTPPAASAQPSLKKQAAAASPRSQPTSRRVAAPRKRPSVRVSS